ncbi:hypothetical protein [Alteribacter populi]|uniref:hypothetical protein n=1 Tax=Alteribacter populi TaxID=2011011 RepID=UPI0012FF68BA|nr:hypothetical protein [Alteribacter populi]
MITIATLSNEVLLKEYKTCVVIASGELITNKTFQYLERLNEVEKEILKRMKQSQ